MSCLTIVELLFNRQSQASAALKGFADIFGKLNMTKYTPLSLHDFSPKKGERLFEILYYCSPFRGAVL
jgi:hypothetical protein